MKVKGRGYENQGGGAMRVKGRSYDNQGEEL